jgi:lipopolysaccharide transport protein LptA
MKSRFTRLLRTALIALLLGLIFTILWYFISHRRGPTVVPPKVEEIAAKKIERQEGIEHFEYRGDRVIQAKAARHYAGEGGQFVLEGNVEIRDLGKTSGRDILVAGNKVTYDKDWTAAVLEGNGRVKYGDLLMESEYFFYQREADLLTTDQGVVFSARRLSGRAARMRYSFLDEMMSLEGDVELRLSDETRSESPFVVKGDAFSYSRKGVNGNAAGNVTFSWDNSHGQCENLEFVLTEDEQYVHEIRLKGDVVVSIIEEVGSSEPAWDPLLAKAKEREMSADEISLRAFLNMNKIHSLDAAGGCSLKSVPAGGGIIQAHSGRMRFVFDRWGGLREYWAVDKASLVERSPASRLDRRISGSEIFIEGQGEVLKVRGGDGEARLDSPDSEVTARDIALIPRYKQLDAAGNVKVILKFEPETAESIGFFSRGKPVFITAQEMRYEKEQKRLLLRENVRMWQDKETVFAQELSILKSSGDISGQGGVRALFPYVPKKEGGKEQQIEVGGLKMVFNPEDHLLTYEQSCWLKTSDIALNSETLIVHLRKDKGEIQKITAKAKVTIKDNLRDGKGEEAVYDLDQETVVLTGRPVIVDKQKGKIEGDKLTFHLGDGRILVENKDRERSVTVIKS